MNILICIDDTDNLESRGTGELATLIASAIDENSWGTCCAVTRHQLLLHEDIPYTSHNSSMCFKADLASENLLSQIIEYAARFLETESAEGSDPGLAVMNIGALPDLKEVIEFGRSAKERVLTKEEAYAFAHKQGIHLSEHGGTGQGVIGALAGIGLRLSGNDGRVKGKLSIGAPGTRLTVSELLDIPQIDTVQSIEGASLSLDESVELGEKVKTVWLNHQAVLLVTDPENWKTCGKQQLRKF